MRTQPHLLLAGTLGVLVPGCLDAAGPVELPPPDAQVGLLVRDGASLVHPSDAIPRRPRIELALTLDPSDAAAEVLLLTGRLDEAVLADLRSPPWSSATRSRAVAVRAAADGTTTVLEPVAPLPLGATLVLVVPPWVRTRSSGFAGHAAALGLTVAREAAGATFVEAFPPSGSQGLPVGLAAIDLAFDDVVEGLDTLELEVGGETMPAWVAPLDCMAAGLLGRACARVSLPAGSSATTARVRGAPRDRFGDVVPVVVGFSTDAAAETRPTPVPLACAPDEQALEAGCLLVLDDRMALRSHFLTPTRLRLRADDREAVTITRYGAAELRLDGLPPRRDLVVTVEAESPGGAVLRAELAVRTADPRPALVVQEVRPNPAGTEPDQESVLLCAMGVDDVPIGGATLSDDPLRAGDRIPSGARLPAGGCVLLVPDGFAPEDPNDLPPPPGLPLVRVGASLGSGGLANGGEPVLVRGPDGARWAWAPAVAVPEAGRCLVRTSAPADVDAPYVVGTCLHGLP